MNRDITKLVNELTTKEDELTTKENELEAKNTELERMGDELDNMGEKLAAKDDELAEKNTELHRKDDELKRKDDEYLDEINNLQNKNQTLQKQIKELIQHTKIEGKNRQAGKENDHEEIGKLKQELKKYKEQLRKLLKTVKTKSKKSSEKIKNLRKRQKMVESKIQEDTLEWLAQQLSIITIKNKNIILSNIESIMNVEIPADWLGGKRKYDGYDRLVSKVICRVSPNNAEISNQPCLLRNFYNFIHHDKNNNEKDFKDAFIKFYYKKISFYKQGGNIDDLDREHIFRMILIQLLKENVMDSSKIMQQVVTQWYYFKTKKSENDNVLRDKLKKERQ